MHLEVGSAIIASNHNGWAFIDLIEVAARLAKLGDKMFAKGSTFVNGHPTTDLRHERDLLCLFA
ncbi:unnamed protein product [Hymenolepis diminuta]|uniref:Uncharacterized protein n=1 Tax=Hymenolepis diminuta TaxID=6216 RepID=A0A564YNZ9_HYMDI|nr:unnamed protein product [Hymenolepis diminuta]